MVIRNLKLLVEELRKKQEKKLKSSGMDSEKLKDKVVVWVNSALTNDQALANITSKEGVRWFGDEPQAGGETCTLLLPTALHLIHWDSFMVSQLDKNGEEVKDKKTGKLVLEFNRDEARDITLELDVWEMRICEADKLKVASSRNQIPMEETFFKIMNQLSRVQQATYRRS